MNKLISANFARLFKSGIFKLYMIFSGGLSAFMIFQRYIQNQDKDNMEYYINHLDPEYYKIDSIVFGGMLYLLFIAPVFVGSFIGTEYSDGTIRNKLIVGHKRSNIYLANLIVCSAGTLMGEALNLLINLTVGVALCGIASLTVTKILTLTLFSFIGLVSATAITVLISMLIKSKASASVAVVMLTFIMLLTSMELMESLSEPEYYEYSFNPTIGETVEPEKNPDYISGTKRKVYQAAYDAMPASHIYEYVAMSTDNTNKFAVYDGIVLVATTALGIFLFRKKELK